MLNTVLKMLTKTVEIFSWYRDKGS